MSAPEGAGPPQTPVTRHSGHGSLARSCCSRAEPDALRSKQQDRTRTTEAASRRKRWPTGASSGSTRTGIAQDVAAARRETAVRRLARRSARGPRGLRAAKRAAPPRKPSRWLKSARTCSVPHDTARDRDDGDRVRAIPSLRVRLPPRWHAFHHSSQRDGRRSDAKQAPVGNTRREHDDASSTPTGCARAMSVL